MLVNTPYTLTYGSVSDPGQTPTQYLIHWGDGNIDAFGSTGTAPHTYTSTGTFTVTADIVDGTGTHTGAGSFIVQVNGAMVVLSANNANANFGGTYTLSLGAINDAGQTATGAW